MRKEGAGWVPDTQGSDYTPDTWQSWEEEYFVVLGYAERAVRTDRYTVEGLRPAGVIDRVQARVLWARLQATCEAWELEEFDRGRFRMVGYRGVERW